MEKPQMLAEGKTKQIWTTPDVVRIRTKDDITAGDGAKHDVFEGKAEYSTETTCNVFELLKRGSVPIAYVARSGKAEFLALNCRMLPFEVVIRGLALGSYLKRHPEAEKGTIFDPPLIEFYLKTSGKNFNGIALEKDDPLIVEKSPDGLVVTNPHMELGTGKMVHIWRGDLEWGPDHDYMDPFSEMEEIAFRVFHILRGAWKRLGHTLADLKIEFGITPDGRLVVADVIDNDSWRLLTKDGVHLDKQRYRDGERIEKVRDLYGEIAQRSSALLHY